MIRPRHLPKIRHQVVKHLSDPASPIRAHTGEDNQAGLDAEAALLRQAGLYWVSPDMAALAVSAGSKLETARWTMADRPSAAGLVVFDGGIGHLGGAAPESTDLHLRGRRVRGQVAIREIFDLDIPIDALLWGTIEGELSLGVYVSRRRMAQAAAAQGMELEVESTPPLVPVKNFHLPITTEPAPLDDLPARAPRPVVAALAAAWLLMQQPKLADRTRLPADKPSRSTAARLDYHDPDVTVVDLRRLYVPDTREETGTAGGRRYRHRWVVSGHWRNAAVGPGRSERRQTWVESYVKGPDGAPLLMTERVNVWRR